MNIISLLANDNYIVVNKDLAKLFGIDCAIMIGELCAEHIYWEKSEKLEDGFFFSTVENIEEQTTFKKDKQAKILNNLQGLGIVEVERKGLPAKRYIKINEDVLNEWLLNGNQSNLKNRQLDISKSDGNNNKLNNIYSFKKESKPSSDGSRYLAKSNSLFSEPEKDKPEKKVTKREKIIREFTDNESLVELMLKWINMSEKRKLSEATLRNNLKKLFTWYDNDIDRLNYLEDNMKHLDANGYVYLGFIKFNTSTYKADTNMDKDIQSSVGRGVSSGVEF